VQRIIASKSQAGAGTGSLRLHKKKETAIAYFQLHSFPSSSFTPKFVAAHSGHPIMITISALRPTMSGVVHSHGLLPLD